MNLFLSYDSDRHALAETIAQRLEAAGHVVFFDRDDLAPGDAYDRRIAAAVAAADAMVFLASEGAVAPGAYALSELALAEARWPNPEGRLIGVALDGLDIAALPAYLRSVSVLQPRGDVAAEVVHAVGLLASRNRRRTLRRSAAAVLTIAVVGGVAVVAWPWLRDGGAPPVFQIVSAAVDPNGGAFRVRAVLHNGSEHRVTTPLLQMEADRDGIRFPSSVEWFDVFPGQRLEHAHDFEVEGVAPGTPFRWRLCWTSVDAFELAQLRDRDLMHELIGRKGHRVCTPLQAWTLPIPAARP